MIVWENGKEKGEVEGEWLYFQDCVVENNNKNTKKG